MDDQDGRSYVRTPTLGDVVRICRSLNSSQARYLLIGGFALILHGARRTTEDIDFLVDASPENVGRLKRALSVLADNAAAEIAGTDVAPLRWLALSAVRRSDLAGRGRSNLAPALERMRAPREAAPQSRRAVSPRSSTQQPGAEAMNANAAKRANTPHASAAPLQSVLTLTINLVNGRIQFEPPLAKGIGLEKGQGVTLALGCGWGEDSFFVGIDFFHNKVVDGNDTPDLSRPAGSWLSDNSHNSVTVFTVKPIDEQRVQIIDQEIVIVDTEDRYWFSVSISDVGNVFRGDPELINKG